MTLDEIITELKQTYEQVDSFQAVRSRKWVCEVSGRRDKFVQGMQLRGEAATEVDAAKDVLERTRAINEAMGNTKLAFVPKRVGRYAELMKNDPITGPYKKAHEGTIDVQPGPLDSSEIRITKADGTVWLTNALIPQNLVGRKVRITVETIDE